MNFLPCTLEGQRARVDGVTIALEPETAALGAKARGVLELGIRPMHLEVHGSPVDEGVPVTMTAVEDQGSFKILTATLKGHTLRARVPEGHPVPENNAWLKFPPQRTKLFADERLVR
jgi:glycerol transport system ATP-binding protein